MNSIKWGLFLLLMILGPGLNAESYQYDSAGRLIQVTYDDNFFLRYTYDANGNLLSRQKMKVELVFKSGFE